MTKLMLVVAAAAFAVAFATASTITFSQCADKALCLSGCQSVTFQAGTCMQNGNGSQVLKCDTVERVCGVLAAFSDPQCTQLQATQGFISGQCNSNRNGNPSRIVAEARGPNNQFLSVQSCLDTSCYSCTTVANVTVGTCIPNKNENGIITGYLTYDGVALCTAVARTAWSVSTSCSGIPNEQELLPQGSCLGGARVTCNFGH